MKRGRETGNAFDRWDMFSTPMPHFNIEGNKKVGTSIGCIFSVLMISLCLAYGGTRGIFFITKSRPLISSYTLTGHRENDEKVNMGKHNFQVAFDLKKIVQGGEDTHIDDSNFVEWLAIYENKDKNGEHHDVTVPTHKCNHDDYKRFNPIVH
jgi:hypothetical protein